MPSRRYSSCSWVGKGGSQELPERHVQQLCRGGGGVASAEGVGTGAFSASSDRILGVESGEGVLGRENPTDRGLTAGVGVGRDGGVSSVILRSR